MRRVYGERHEPIMDIVSRDFDGRLTPLPSTGGLHLAAVLSENGGSADMAIAQRARAAGVAVLPMSYHYLTTPPRPGLLLGYGAIPADRIADGLRRLSDCL
jgi:GntR family transcriptional regulator/MocR family aminotransferase